jgi:hypothetical protein
MLSRVNINLSVVTFGMRLHVFKMRMVLPCGPSLPAWLTQTSRYFIWDVLDAGVQHGNYLLPLSRLWTFVLSKPLARR